MKKTIIIGTLFLMGTVGLYADCLTQQEIEALSFTSISGRYEN